MVLAAVAATAVAMLWFTEPRLGATIAVGSGGGCCGCGGGGKGCCVAEVPLG